MSFEGILNQIFQPYFYYSIIFLVISFACVKALTRYCSFIGQKTKSLLYLVPLAVPLIVMLTFMPSTVIQTSSQLIKTSAAGTITTGAHVNAFYTGAAMLPMPPPSVFILARAAPVTVYSVTGILCIIGLVAGGFFALSMLAADDRVARKVLHVILLSPGENQWLQIKVAELSKKLAITAPKIGLIEDLRPNAFTIGYAENSTIVFSIGLLKTLEQEEVVAVAAHELAHVKNHDFFYKTATSALTVVSFFNPLAYIASSSGQREREMLADEDAIRVLEKPAAFGNALAKICKAIQNLPKESLLVSFSSNLLVSSSVLHRVGILSTHPRLDMRLRNISQPKHIHLNHHNVGLAFFLSLLLVCSAVAVSFAMVNLQTDFIASHQFKTLPLDFKNTGYAIIGTADFASSGPVTANFSVARTMNMPIVVGPASAANNQWIYSCGS